MALYRQIYTSFWTDPKIDDDFSPEDKYFYLYLLTNSHTNICGCYEISMKQFTRELGYNDDTIRLLLKRMEDVHKVIRYSPETKEVLLLNWHKYNWSRSPNVMKGIAEGIPYIKNNSFKAYVRDMLDGRGRSGTVGDGIPTSVYSSVTVTDTVNSTEEGNRGVGEEGEPRPETKAKKAVRDRHTIPPTVEEVAEYCKMRNNGIDAEEFWDFYTGKGWKIGKDPMKDWQASVRTWEKRKGEEENGTGKNRGSGRSGSCKQNTERITDFSSIRPSLDPDDTDTWRLRA